MKARLRKRFLLIIILFSAVVGPVTAQYEGKLGIVMGSVKANAFADMVKAGLPWDHGSPDNPLTAAELDSLLWPKEDFRFLLMDNRPVPEWNNLIDDPEEYRIDYSGTYKGSFNGIASIANLGGPWTIQNQQYDSTENLTTFDLIIGSPGQNHGLVIMNFSNTRRTVGSPANSGITNLKIIRPGYEDRQDQFFSNQLFDALNSAGFAVIRDQGFTGATSWDIIYPERYEWNRRKLPGDPIQGRSHNERLESVAWEHFIDLCNDTGKDIWLNIPIAASDDYVRILASLVKSRLDTALKIYIENDNEVWNSAPDFIGTYNYNQAEAASMGLTEEENIGRRAVRLSQLFAEVFGQEEVNKRFRVILASHAPMLKWWVIPMLEYIRDNFGEPKDFIYAISRQLYISSANAETLSSDAIINELYESIRYQLADNPVNEAGRLDWIRVAGEWELPGGATSYEGGIHTPAGGSTVNLDAQIMMHRSHRMINLLRYNFANHWFDIGGGLAMYFTLVSGYNRYGCWGLTDDLGNPERNYKMEAIRNLQAVTGLPEKSGPVEKTIFIYPNPAEEKVTLFTGTKEPLTIEIYNLNGKIVFFSESYISGTTLELDYLVTGMYVIRMKNKNQSFTEKLFIR